MNKLSKKTLQDELKTAMLTKDTVKTSVLRLLLSAINYYEIQKGGAGYEATNEDIISVIQKEVKQRNDSIEQYKLAKRDDLASKESEELDILKQYLPKQLSEEEIANLVRNAIAETGAKTPHDMGKIMGILMPKVKGKADGSLVSKITKETLGS